MARLRKITHLSCASVPASKNDAVRNEVDGAAPPFELLLQPRSRFGVAAKVESNSSEKTLDTRLLSFEGSFAQPLPSCDKF